MSVQIISKRKFKMDEKEELMSLLGELGIRSKEQPGHLARKILESLDNPGEYLVMSEWETADNWEKWYISKERRDIQGKIDSLIGEKTFYEIWLIRLNRT